MTYYCSKTLRPMDKRVRAPKPIFLMPLQSPWEGARYDNDLAYAPAQGWLGPLKPKGPCAVPTQSTHLLRCCVWVFGSSNISCQYSPFSRLILHLLQISPQHLQHQIIHFQELLGYVVKLIMILYMIMSEWGNIVQWGERVATVPQIYVEILTKSYRFPYFLFKYFAMIT